MKSANGPFRIAIVEDHAILREELACFLTGRGFKVHEFGSGVTLGPLLQAKAFDLLILDVNLPGPSGFDIARLAKQHGDNIGIIMLTARAHLADKINGYDSGADIYLPKPVAPEELLAAVRSLLRRNANVGNQDAWQLNVFSHQLSGQSAEHVVSLTATESALLQALAEAPDQKLSTDELMGLVGRASGDAIFSKRALENAVSRLRKKICAAAHMHEEPVVHAIWGVGYQLCIAVAIVRRLPGEVPSSNNRREAGSY
jgi:DNA-binding response OmpR family regulator